MDTYGKVLLAIYSLAFIGAIAGFLSYARKVPKTALLAAVGIYGAGVVVSIIADTSRELHGLGGLLKLSGFAGGIIALVSYNKKRRDPWNEA